jgi:hypothetical protein
MILTSSFSFGQIKAPKEYKQKDHKYQSFFGVQVKPIVPLHVFGTGPVTLSEDGFTAEITPVFSNSFGAVIRAGISDQMAIETGINMVKRNYRTHYALPDSGLAAMTSLSIVNYDIPLNLLVYVKINQKLFMNASFGFSTIFLPSNVRAYEENYPHYFITEGLRKNWFQLALNANFGVEYRTEKNGSFYLGTSFQNPFSSFFIVATAYKYKAINRPVYGEMRGTYITFDVKYFFPTIERKGPQFIKGPI